MDLTDWRIWVF